MRVLRYLTAAIAGFVAMEALVFVAGFLAARSTPSGYFEYFGRESQVLALALWSSIAFALPMFIVGGVLALLAARALQFGSTKGTVALFAIGAAASFATYLAGAALAHPSTASFSGALWHELASYWPRALWELPSGPWAGWVGLAAGLFVAVRSCPGRR